MAAISFSKVAGCRY